MRLRFAQEVLCQLVDKYSRFDCRRIERILILTFHRFWYGRTCFVRLGGPQGTKHDLTISIAATDDRGAGDAMERKLTAILCADVHGYSRLMGGNEEATVSTLNSYRNIIDSLIARHRGRFVGSAGDSVLAEFASVVEAVQCAVEIQDTLKAENQNMPPERRMEFRIGVNSGDVMVEGEQIYGDGVNVAARLESLADPGGICISRTVYENIRNKLPLSYENLGEQTVKNIAEPVHAWRVLLDGALPSPRTVPRI